MNDIVAAIARMDIFSLLVDIVPREGLMDEVLGSAVGEGLGASKIGSNSCFFIEGNSFMDRLDDKHASPHILHSRYVEYFSPVIYLLTNCSHVCLP